ncbi:MAG: YfhO family protein [bacterium]
MAKPRQDTQTRGQKPKARVQGAGRKARNWAWLPLAVLGAGAVVMFLEVLLGRKYLWSDTMSFYYPYHYHLFASLRGLSLTLWNPYVFAGTPFLADVQSGVFYPLNWLLAAISSPSQGWTFWLVEFKVVLHVFGAAAFAYYLGRELKLSRYAALLTGAVYGLGGFFITHTVHLSIVSTLTWLPLILALEHRAIERRSLRHAAWAGLAFGAACLAGHPQAALMTGYAVVPYWLWCVVANWREERGRLGGHLAGLGVLLGVGLAMSAAAFLPAADNARWTVRAAMSWADAASGSLPPTLPLLLLVPKFFGAIAGGRPEGALFWGNPQTFMYWESCVYVGILPLLLAAAAVLKTNRQRLFFLALGLLATLLALGRLTPLHWLAYNALPGFDRFRIAARYGALAALSVAVLAGFGLDDLLADPARARRLLKPALVFGGLCALGFGLLATGVLRGLASAFADPELLAGSVRHSGIALGLIALAVAWLWLAGRRVRGSPAAGVLAVALVMLDLAWFGWSFSRGPAGPNDIYQRNTLVRTLQDAARTHVFRVNARIGFDMVLEVNEGMVNGIEQLEGFTPLRLADYTALDQISLDRRTMLLNAVWRLRIDSAAGVMTLDTNPQALPRARMFHRWTVEPDRDRALALLGDSLFDLHAALTLDADPLVPQDTGGQDSVAFIERRPNRMRLRVENERPGVLFLSEMFHPSWRATVDGRPAPILRADAVLRGVALPAGTHEVELHYDTGIIRLGVLISALGLALGLALALLRRRRLDAGSARH